MSKIRRSVIWSFAAVLAVLITAGSCSDMMMQLDRVELEIGDLIYLRSSTGEDIEGKVVDTSGDGIPDGIDITGNNSADLNLKTGDSEHAPEIGYYAVDVNGEVFYLQVNPHGASSMKTEGGAISVLTTYSVNHYLQDVEGDGFTLHEVREFLGASGTTAQAAVHTYTGFEEDIEHDDRLDAGSIASDGSLELRRYYTRTLHEITFHMNGGSPQISPYTDIRYEANIPAPSDFSKEGYDFLGWKTSSDTNWNFDKDSVTKDKDLYAHWTANQYTVTFDKQEGAGGNDTVEVTFDEPMPIADAPTRTGYTFEGYYDHKDGTGTKYFNDDMSSAAAWNISSDTTLYAHWTANQYTVTFDKQGGTGVSNTVEVTFDEPMPIADAPTRIGYTFQGYYDQKGGTGTKYYNDDMSSAAQWDKDDNTSLFAHWTAKSYTVTYHNLEGAENHSENPETYTIEDTPAELKTPTRVGYTFSGWYETSEFTGDAVTEITVGSTGAVEVYAKWTAEVSFDSQQADTNAVPESKTVVWTSGSDTVDALPADPVKTGYTFGGWWTQESGGGSKFTIDSEITGDITVYAKWTANQYTVTFNKQEGTGGTDNVTATFDAAMPDAVAPSRTGYTFGGYYDHKDGTGTKYYNDDMSSAAQWDKDDNTSLFAHWTAKSYTVTYHNLEGAENHSENPETYTIEDTPAELKTPTRVGYTFSGWYETSEFTGDAVTEITVGSTGAVEVYAKWTAEVSFDSQQADTNAVPESKTVVWTSGSDTVDALPADPVKTGYTFGGWWTQESGGGTEFTDAVEITGDITVYAKWTANQYTVTFDKQDGTGGSTSVEATFDAAMPPADAPARTGYTFGGYFSQKYGQGTQYYNHDMSSAAAWNISSDTTLYAHWTANQYTVTFDKQEGTGGSNTVEAIFDAAMPPADAPTRIGYTFQGYYDEKDGKGTQYYNHDMSSAAAWNISSNTTLYAHWMANQYTVAFNKQGGTGGNDTVEATFDDPMPIAVAPTRIGYTFEGYYDQKGGTGTKYFNHDMSSAAAWNIASASTLYAHWTTNQYTVTFDKQEGSGGSATVEVTFDEPMPNADAPTRIGYTFEGYYDQKDGTGTKYFNDDMSSAAAWNISSDTTLYAHWTANTYTVTYHNLEGAENHSENPETYTIEDTHVELKTPTRAGYTFRGWYETSELTGDAVTEIAAGSTGAVKVYAKWTALVTFDSQNADTNADPGSKTVVWTSGSDTIDALPEDPVRTGYTFGGWWTETSGGGTEFTDAVEITGDITVYAKWTANQYTVTFDKHEGTGGNDTVEVTFDEPMPIADAPTRIGYTFEGYYDQKDGTGTKYYNHDMSSAAQWDKDDDASLFAHWTANTYTVTFDRQSGTGGTSSATATYDTSMPSATAPTRNEYTFSGYYDQPEGTGNQYYDADMASIRDWDKASSASLYAKWTAAVTFDSQDADLAANPGTREVVYTSEKDTVELPAPPEKTGYTFERWWTQENGGGSDFTESTEVTGHITVYAKWTANQYTVTFDKQDGTDGSATVEVTYDEPMPNADAPTRTGYTFEGYFSEEYGQGVQYYNHDMSSAAAWNSASASTLYAHWTANQYTVTFDKQEGTGGSDNVSATFDAAMPAADTPTRTGYTFSGYFNKKDGKGTQYYNHNMSSTAAWNSASASTLYAHWTANQYTVTFDKQDGTDGSDSVLATFDAPMPDAGEPTRTGYTFSGYFSEENGGGVQYYNHDMSSTAAWNIASAYTLYAHWTANQYTVTFDKQEGSGGSDSVSATFDSLMPSAEEPSRTGYNFMGYYDQKDGSGTQYYTADMERIREWDKDSDAILYAYWSAETFTVYLYAQGDSLEGAVHATYDSSMPPEAIPIKFGYTFNGYYDFSGRQYYDEHMQSTRNWDKAERTIHILFAKWTAAVTFDSQDANLAANPGTREVVYTSEKDTVELPAPPEKTGYTFAGWWTQENGGGSEFTESTEVTGHITVYAKWTANQYTVTFDKQDGTGGCDSVLATFDAAMPTATQPEREGYSFSGYYTEAGGAGTQFYNADMNSARNWDIAGNTTLYAHWTVNTYTVTLDWQDGTGGTESVDAEFDASMPTATQPEREGYAFSGYYTKADGAGHQYYTSSMESVKDWDIPEDTDLYAKWEIITYDITYNLDGGNNHSENPDTYTVEDEISLEDPSKTGSIFLGWFDNPGFTGVPITDISSGSTGAVDLYAKWEIRLTFTGRLEDTGGDTDAISLFIEWGTQQDVSEYGTLSAAEPSTTGSNNSDFSYTLHGADIQKTYYYRAVVTSNAGRVEGDLYRTSYDGDSGLFTHEKVSDSTSPTGPASGSLRVADYGTGTGTGGFWFRGYDFTVTQNTTVTHLIGGGTGGEFTLVLYEGTVDDSGSYPKATGTTKLAHVTISGNNEQVTKPISHVTLTPGKTYILAQGRSSGSGSHITTPNLDVEDLKSHPRIATWGPLASDGSGGAVYRWTDATHDDHPEDHILDTESGDINNLIPRLGFLFDADGLEYAEVITQGVMQSGAGE